MSQTGRNIIGRFKTALRRKFIPPQMRFVFLGWKPKVLARRASLPAPKDVGWYLDELLNGHEKPDFPPGIWFIDVPAGYYNWKDSSTNIGAPILVTYDRTRIDEAGIRAYLGRIGLIVE